MVNHARNNNTIRSRDNELYEFASSGLKPDIILRECVHTQEMHRERTGEGTGRSGHRNGRNREKTCKNVAEYKHRSAVEVIRTRTPP